MKDLRLRSIANISSHKLEIISTWVILFQLASMFFGFRSGAYSALIFMLDIVSVLLLTVAHKEAKEVQKYVNKLTKDEK
jgi:hypothetical protein